MSAATGKPAPRRGPRKESEIRADVEAEIRAEVEAKIRADMEASSEAMRAELEANVRAEVAAEVAQKDAADAKARAEAAEARPVSGRDLDGDPSKEGSLTVHFVDDGMTLLGKVWYRGENLTITPGTKQWEEAHAVLSLDEFEQEDRWGKRHFRQGAWRGKKINEIDDELLTDADRAQLAKAAQIHKERYGV